MTYCDGLRARHWRIMPRSVGMRAPVCIHCGSPNPKPLSDEEWVQVIDWAQHYYAGGYVLSAIEARERSLAVRGVP